jgi:hypothetical protein
LSPCQVITDRLGKGTILLPVLPGQLDAESIALLLIERYISLHWIPKSIVSDRGPQFVNAMWARICQLLQIDRRLSTAYHPETDGATERRNQEVEVYLRAFVAYNQADWNRWLPLAQIALDNKPASTTGVSPFFLTHGYNATPIATTEELQETEDTNDPRTIGEAIVRKLQDAQEFAQAAMAAAQQTQEQYANRRRQASWSFKVGDKVWLNLRNITTQRPSKKLDWVHAKYTITRTFKGSPHFYELDVPRGVHNKFHVSLLRPAADDELPSQVRDDQQPPAIQSNGDELYDVDEILCCRSKRIGRGYRREALVKWTGFAEPTWNHLENLQNTLALQAFEAQYGNAWRNDGPLERYVQARPRRGGR